MAHTLVGIRNVDFKGEDGSPVSGVNMYFTFPQENCDGVACERVFLASRKFARLTYVPQIGGTCVLQWNRYGKVEDIVAS